MTKNPSLVSLCLLFYITEALSKAQIIQRSGERRAFHTEELISKAEISAMASAAKESAIQAWYIDDSPEDYRLPHHVNPPKYVTPEQLRELGVLNWTLDADNYENDEEYKKVYASQGYTYSDIVEVSPEVLPNYEETLKSWFEERTGHEDKTRFCIGGSGYFDVKDREGKWIRIWQKKGGLIVMTAGVTHRYTLDTDNYHKVIRLFVKKP